MAAELAREGGWFDVSTLKEPYRLEGKKIMGYELAAHFRWRLPDVIIYPTGGGTGLIGMWKAFAELQTLGWIDGHRPRMVAVQSAGCAPVVKAFLDGAEDTVYWSDAHTDAAGLRVPATIGGRMMLRVLRESGGVGLAVDDADILRAQKHLASVEGIYVSLEAAATVAGLEELVNSGWIGPAESVILFGTGSGLKQTFSS
jgi:threonine synthase